MKVGKRALVAVVVIAIGWALMVVAYDKAQWFFQAAGVVGVLLVLGAALWWFVSARRPMSANRGSPTNEPKNV